METLKWYGIVWDEPVIKQSTRLGVYREIGEALISQKKAYRCFCSKERLESLRSSMIRPGYDRHCRNLDEAYTRRTKDLPHVVRLRMPSADRRISFIDHVFGHISHQSGTMEDAVLIKADGYPTYHFANVIDDHESRINLVMRGSEWIPSTPLHLILYEVLGWEKPKFAHLPLLIRQDGTKLSKRHADINVGHLRQEGFLPEALLNFVAFLGWTPSNGIASEIMNMAELIQAFEISKINKSESQVDMSKLAWINRQHLNLRIANDPDQLASELSEMLPSHWERASDLEYCKSVIMLMKDRIYTLRDIPNLCSYFFTLLTTRETCPTSVPLEAQERLTKHLLDSIQKGTDFKDSIQQAFSKSSAITSTLKKTEIMAFYRWLLTGTRVGAPLIDTAAVLGREEVLRRLHL